MLRPIALVSFAGVLAVLANNEWDQCGGTDDQGNPWDADHGHDVTCPDVIDKCVYVNDFYSQCQPVDLCLNPQFGQCGGIDQKGDPWDKAHDHQICCPESFDCFLQDQYYSQCLYNNTDHTCAEKFEQCGGKDADGNPWGTKPDVEKTCCIGGYECVKDNEYYSGCKPLPVCTNARFGQCGGTDKDNNPWDKAHGHDICCPPSFKCELQSVYYSQCVWANTTAPLEKRLLF